MMQLMTPRQRKQSRSTSEGEGLRRNALAFPKLRVSLRHDAARGWIRLSFDPGEGE